MAEDDEGRGSVAAEVGGVGEVPAPSGGWQAMGEGERGGAINKPRTTMEEMEVGGEEMEKEGV